MTEQEQKRARVLAVIENEITSLEDKDLDTWLEKVQGLTRSMVKTIWMLYCRDCNYGWLEPYIATARMHMRKNVTCPKCGCKYFSGGGNEPWLAEQYIQEHNAQNGHNE